MKSNVGTADRVIRILIGLGFLVAGLAFQSAWGLIGLVPLFTATIGFCPLYRLVGLSTCPTRRK